MFSQIFSYKGLVWRILDTLTDIFALSLLWIVCSLPLVTLGAASTALYDSVVRCVRYKQPKPYARFFRTLRNELKTGIFSTLLWGFVAGIGVFVLLALRQLGTFDRSALAAAAAWYVVLLIPIGAACWAFPLLSRFTFDFLPLNLTAGRLALAHLPSTLIIVLLIIECARLCLDWFFPLFFMPAVCVLLLSLFTEPAFAKQGGGLSREDEETNEE